MTVSDSICFQSLGDSAVVVHLGSEILPEIHDHVMALWRSLQKMPFPGPIECVPAYATLTVHYDPLAVDLRGTATSRQNAVITSIRQQLHDLKPGYQVVGKQFRIPVLYGRESGPDLDDVAQWSGLTTDDVTALHSGRSYRVYMIGFTPGFPYMGKVEKAIAMPRKKTPRVHVVAGAVGIAGFQTGIYPFESPGGWQIIGRTPVSLFRTDLASPCLLSPGDRVQFYAVNPEEYERLSREAD